MNPYTVAAAVIFVHEHTALVPGKYNAVAMSPLTLADLNRDPERNWLSSQEGSSLRIGGVQIFLDPTLAESELQMVALSHQGDLP